MMKTRAVMLALSIGIVAAACTTTLGTDPGDQGAVAPTTVPQAADTSSLVVVDGSGGVVVIDPSGTEVESFTPPSGTLYTQPIWASADTIVYAQSAPRNNRLEAARLGGDTVWSVALDTPPFYYLADAGADEPTIVSLRNNANAPGLVIEKISGSGVLEAVSDEAPFYASWNPDDGRLASHIGDARLDVSGTSTETIDSDASGFQAPVWLDSGLITLTNRDSDSFLARWDGQTFTDIAKVRGAARFVGSGHRLAIVTGGDIQTGGVQASAQALPTISSGVLTVIDLEDDSITSVTTEPTPIFQWDPAGEKLLYVTFVDDPSPALVWHVWENGEDTDFEPFVPEPSWFGTVAPFFDQYAQSVSLWSPDGSAFAYPALVDGNPEIMVQRLGESSPTPITPGTWVSWSP
jgi:hypothetical protein